MSYILTEAELLSIRNAFQENNAASVKLTKSKLKQMVSVVENGGQIKLESSGVLFSTISELETWVRSFLNLDLNTFLEE
jgi:hypothetical protein